MNNQPSTAQEFFQEGKKFVRLSTQKKRNICVVPDIFNGEVRISIRDFFPAEEETDSTRPHLLPTKRGVSLSKEEFNNLCETLETTKNQVKRLDTKIETKNEKKTAVGEWKDQDGWFFLVRPDIVLVARCLGFECSESGF